ncbi:MAG: aminodeoxychorismate/anthranilate synthase component II [Deltaproteobacteria bacterium]|nr:aminodeoxychorismate/anthranilate synthase component II [Deltaproteobacteria bacterium]
MRHERASVLFIDNFDSFVFNLVDEFARRECNVEVWRNDISADQALEIAAGIAKPKLVVLSPGPGTPAAAGCCAELIRKAPEDLAIFGVCLGHQSIIEAFGGEVVRAGEIVHGKASGIDHDGRGIFEGLPTPMTVGRYHSLAAGAVPEALEITARLGDIVMGVRHVSRPLMGVQFHPESILTPLGGRLIDNVLRMTRAQRNTTV